MPAALGALIVGAVGVEATTLVGIGSLTVGGLVGSVAFGAISIGLQYALGAANQKKDKIASQQFSQRQAMPVRKKSYGKVKISGPKIAYDAANGSFYDTFYFGEGPIDCFEQVWLDDIRTGIDNVTREGGHISASSAVAPYYEYVQIELFHGEASQPASSFLSELSYWSAAHRLDGCAYSAVKSIAPAQKYFARFFPGSRPPQNVRVVMRSSLCVDPRNPSAPPAWSDVTGVVAYDFMQSQDGMRIPAVYLDTDSWVAFANRCGQGILYKDGSVNPRYRCGGEYDLTADPVDTLQDILGTADASLYLTPAGKIGVMGGAFPEPTVTLTDEDIVSMDLQAGTSKLRLVNRLKISWVSEAHGFTQVEGPAWDDLESQALLDDIVEDDFQRPWVRNLNQLERLAKVHLAKQNPDWRISRLVTRRSGVKALFEESVRITSASGGLDEVFIIEAASAVSDGRSCTYQLKSLRPDAYDFDPSTEEGDPPLVPGDQGVASVIADPTGVSVIVERRAVSGDTVALLLHLTATPPDRADVSLIGQYRRVGDPDWLAMGQDAADNSVSLISSVLVDGEQYEAQAAFATAGLGQQSNWEAVGPVTAVADPIAPDPPIGTLVTYLGSLQVAINWTNGGSANVSRTIVSRAAGASASFGTATAVTTVFGGPNQVGGYQDSAPAAGAYRYWLQCANASGVASAPVGPLDVTVS